MEVDEKIDISPKQDGGVLKKIIKEGTGSATPTTGSKVTVHYVGKLTDGTVFDSSRERSEPFKFDLGRGNVIKAWDIGVATMKKGEVALLTCAPEYAYGSTGSPPKIPPNATLEFEVEVLDWVGEDLSPEKDFSIERYQIKAGEGYATPNDGALVDIHLVGKFEGRVFEERDVQFNLGEGEEFGIIEGVERALEKFKKGEHSRLIIKPKYAFKNVHNEQFNIPPYSTVEYEVTLKTFEKAKESWSMDDDERLEQAKILKEKGTNYFKKERFKVACKMYKNAESFLDGIDKDLEDEEKVKEAKDLQLSIHLNLGLCYLKLGEYIQARDSCTAALKLNENSTKGYFRRGQALLELGEPELALKDFEKVLSIEPTNKAAISQIAVCKKRIIEHKNKEKKIYANMFEKFAKKDAEV